MIRSLMFSVTFLTIVLGFCMASCKNDNEVTPNKSRNIRYELKGTYTGKMTVVYTLANGGTQAFSDIRLPWTMEVAYENSVGGIGFGGNGDVSLSNVPGQTVSINIYSDNKVVKTGSATVDSNQVLLLPSLAYVFP
ncbi:MAG: hypothetical protein HOP08_08555 [Cyclobacteriaceae bacterium]|nr:hypothetical protein [Cyclobacteriaceae bacterium]